MELKLTLFLLELCLTTMLAIADPQVSHSGVYQRFFSNTVSEDNAAWLLEVRAPGNIAIAECLYMAACI